MGACRLTANNLGGELMLGLENANGNKMFRSTSVVSDCQLSAASDYKYEGLLRSERLDFDISNCLNTLRAINNAYDDQHQFDVNKLDQMEKIIKELKEKVTAKSASFRKTNHEHQ